jgi:hypothetical protein
LTILIVVGVAPVFETEKVSPTAAPGKEFGVGFAMSVTVTVPRFAAEAGEERANTRPEVNVTMTNNRRFTDPPSTPGT